MPAALLTAAGTEGVAGAGSWRGRGDAQEAPELIGTGALSHGGSTEGAGVRSRHSEPLAARARPPWCSGQRATVSRSGARGPGEGGRWWLRVCPAALGRGEQGPVPRGFALGGGMCCDCCSCREPRAPHRGTNPAAPGRVPAAGTPGFLCWWGGETMLGSCSAVGPCATSVPGEVSVLASRPPALLCLRPGSPGLSTAAAVQSQGRVNAAFLPQKKLLRLGFLFLWLLLTWLGCLSRVLSLRRGGTFRGSGAALPSLPPCSLILHHAYPGDPGWSPCPLPGGQEEAELRACLRPAPALS